MEAVFDPDAYYTDLERVVSLTRSPIQHVGEKTESEIYRTLLSRVAVLPRFLVLEAGINPMPYLGAFIKKNRRDFYGDAQASVSFNWIQALTVGFQESYALSLFVRHVAEFDVPESTEIRGIGYNGYLYSVGNYHIRNNESSHDRWQEIEWEMKGDRKSYVDKKWPLENRKIALALANGFVWESSAEYSEPLATGQSNSLQFLLRPNIVF